jgi:hypothetical protein
MPHLFIIRTTETHSKANSEISISQAMSFGLKRGRLKLKEISPELCREKSNNSRQ